MSSTDRPPPPPGWYADPGGDEGHRWWDGSEWGIHEREWSPPSGLAPDAPVIVGFVLAVLLGGVFGGIISIPFLESSTDLLVLTSSVGLYGGFLFVARWWSVRHGSGDMVTDYGWRVRWRDAWTGLGQSLLARLGAGVVGVIVSLFVSETREGPGPQFGGLDLSGPNLVILGVVIVMLAPVFEELLFRGMMQPVLVRRWSPRTGIVVTSALFSVMHVLPGATVAENVISVASTFVIGLVLGRVAHRAGDLSAAMWTHALFNLLTMVVVVLAF